MKALAQTFRGCSGTRKFRAIAKRLATHARPPATEKPASEERLEKARSREPFSDGRKFRPFVASETRESCRPFSDGRKNPLQEPTRRARRTQIEGRGCRNFPTRRRLATACQISRARTLGCPSSDGCKFLATCGPSLSSTPARRRPAALAVALLASRCRAWRARAGQGQQDIASVS